MLASLISILLLVSTAGSDINDNVAEYLHSHLKDYKKIEFEILKMPKDYSSIDILKSKPFKTNGNIVYVPVKIVKKKRTVQSYISVKLKLFKEVLVTNSNVRRNEQLNKSDFELSLQNVAGLHNEPVISNDSLKCYRSKKYLREGKILLKNDIEKLPVINIGDRVKASMVNGNVMIQTEAVSKQEGGIGDKIIIETSANKQFKAKVVDNNNVIIIE